MKNSKKSPRGITLVALVITIIILLILATISIQALTNQGLFGRTNDAKKESEIANIKEQIALDIYEKQLVPPFGSITDEQLETILGKYGTVNKEDGTIVGITTGKGYEILLKDIYGGKTVAESVQDGAIVNPVNDITTWLKTGEISKQYSYTTIEQVIADSTCIESLMNNENAMKYLARSTEFADAICASETTMTYLGKSAYVDDTVLNSDLWVSAICDSTFFESVLNVKVPTKTSNTEPSGRCFSTSEWSSSYLTYYAFDNNKQTRWASKYEDTYPRYIGFKFESPVCCKRVYFDNVVLYEGSGKSVKDFVIEASNDNSTWMTLHTGIFNNEIYSGEDSHQHSEEYITIHNNSSYLYYRIRILSSWSTASLGNRFAENSFWSLQFYGRYKN